MSPSERDGLLRDLGLILRAAAARPIERDGCARSDSVTRGVPRGPKGLGAKGLDQFSA